MRRWRGPPTASTHRKKVTTPQDAPSRRASRPPGWAGRRAPGPWRAPGAGFAATRAPEAPTADLLVKARRRPAPRWPAESCPPPPPPLSHHPHRCTTTARRLSATPCRSPSSRAGCPGRPRHNTPHTSSGRWRPSAARALRRACRRSGPRRGAVLCYRSIGARERAAGPSCPSSSSVCVSGGRRPPSSSRTCLFALSPPSGLPWLAARSPQLV